MKLWLLLLLLPVAAFAQDDPWAEDEWEEDWSEDEQAQVWSGFIEGGFGTRFNKDPLISNRDTLGEIRLRTETEWEFDKLSIGFKADGGYDGVERTWFGDLRDLTAAFSIGKNIDAKIGRQVQTWGTGDLVFLNDLFPKDFVSFFSGRDDEYLKAPGNAVRLSHFSSAINVDFVWTPVFESDIYLTGERFSFFSPLAGGNVAPDPPLSAVEPDRAFSNGEFALRLFRTVKGNEYALYAYHGFFKQPSALTPQLQATFAPMTSLGASLRRSAGPGLFNSEVSYYLSRDDRSGSDPLVPNDQLRLLLGYEWEAKPRFSVGFQYYLEWTMDHDALLTNSPYPQYEPDEYRHLFTNRLTYRTGMDKYIWSLFTFYSPSDGDAYLRPKLSYRHSDQWSLDVGANLFGGDKPYTFFSQLEDASNAWLRLRFHY